MSTKQYQGSCHCGKVKYSVNIDFSTGTGRCNCTFCTKARYWGKMVKPDDFKLLSGAEDLVDYTKGKPLSLAKGEKPEANSAHHLFCKHCGIRSFGLGHIPEIGGEYYSINVACLDNVDFKEVMGSPMQFFDGRTNNWFNKPEYTAHL